MADPAPLNIGVIGASGRMGRLIMAEAIRRADFNLVGGVVSHDSVQLGADLGELAGLPYIGIETVVSLEEGTRGADVVIDVSKANVSPAMVRRLAANGGPAYICGVTGLDSGGKTALREAALTIPVLHARNFSLGVSVMERLVAEAAKVLRDQHYDIEISETHHRYKADAPSGTALALGEAAANARDTHLEHVARMGVERQSEARPAGTIGFASQRGGNVIGEHDVRFLGAFEEIRICHRAFDRLVFAKGALDAALWLKDQPTGFYTMQDVVGEPGEE